MQEDNSAKIKVSVIIPVYNAGKALYRCLDSLCQQALSEIEFVCVLDCPTDDSGTIVERYAEHDTRFIVVRNKSNLGVGECRNIGVKNAHGEYIGFADDDDYIDSPTYYEDLFETAKQKEADVVLSGTVIDREEGKEIVYPMADISTYSHLQSILLPENSVLCKNKLARSVWHSIYRRNFLLANNICFYDRKTCLEEDSLFNLQVYCRTKNYVVLPLANYHWNLTGQRNAANYRATYDMLALHTFFSVVKEQVVSSDLLSSMQKDNLLAGCLSAHFYTKYCAYRNVCIDTVAQMWQKDMDYVRLKSVLLVCFNNSLSRIRHNWIMIVKFIGYMWKVKWLVGWKNK